MRIRITLIILLAAFSMILFGCGGTSSPVTNPLDNNGRTVEWYANPPVTFDLLAGQTIDVGDVTVWNDLDTLYVEYEITDLTWWMVESNVAVATSLAGIPQKNGNPIPGQFPYKTTHNPAVQYFLYEIPLDRVIGTELYIATHATVTQYDEMGYQINGNTGWAGDHKFPGKRWAYYFHWTVQECYINLPDVQVTATMYYPGTQSYWSHVLSNVPSGYDVTNGTYLAWCLQQNVYAYPGTPYQATLYAATDPDLPAIFDPFDWNRINWVLNHKGTAVINDIQQAIWYFTGAYAYGSLTPGAKALVDDAIANGGTFVPGPGEIMAVIIYVGNTVQSTFIEVECGC